MTAKKTAGSKSSGKKTQTKTKSESNNKKQKREYSKVIVGWVFILLLAFFIYSGYEMHRLNDLSAMEYVSDVLKWLGTAAVGFYFWKAKAENTARLNLEYSEESAKLRKQYGDNFVVQEINVDND